MKPIQWSVVFAILVVILGGAFWYIQFQNKEAEVTITPFVNTSQEEPTPNFNTNINTSTKVEVEVATTTLDSVGNYSGSGVATRIFANRTSTHTVSVKIADPASGKFYDGQLVNMSLTPKFFSTGKLKKENGEYKLTFTDNKDYTKYNSTATSEETEVNDLDNVPEAHVLEGTFPN